MTSPHGRLRPENRPRRHLDDLLAAFPAVSRVTSVAGAAPVELTGVAVTTADVEPGDLFVALTGQRSHGASHLPAAVDAGAVAVLTDAAGATLLGGRSSDEGSSLPGTPGTPGIGSALPVLVAEDPRSMLGEISAWFYDHPAHALTLLGVTGTNGKTTTTYFLEAAMAAVHDATAVVGTVELRIGEESVESPRTTVEAPVLHGLLARMRERGVGACAMEVSSHALALGRVGGVQFDVAGFTNLQRDHLDFHGDMEGYFADKARLFSPERAKRAVVCVDDEWGARLAAEVQVPVDTVATGPDAVGADRAQWHVRDASIGLDGVGSTFTLTGPDGVVVQAASPLPGVVNVSNAALAVVMAHRAGVPLEVAAAAIGSAHAIPGRMERVVERTAELPLCIVDYAHTPDALELALQAVRPITPGRLVLVLGSDGDRDRGKRPIMGEIAARLADVVVVTDENPRSEDPATIRAAVLDGARAVRPDGRDLHEHAPRGDAVALGVRLAGPQDTVLVTGKGHEPTQEVAGVFHRYNDRDAFLVAVGAVRGSTDAAGTGPEEDHR